MTATTERISTLEHAGLTFDVFDEGPLDGELVVLLHGFPERSSSWRDVAPILHERGYRTIAMDQRGYSPGARPRRRRDYRLPTLADDVAALVERVGGTVHLVGHDWCALVDRSLLGKRVSVPTTFVWSDGDSAVARAGAERTAKYVEGPYELVTLEGVSHWIPTQAPEACAEAILARIAA